MVRTCIQLSMRLLNSGSILARVGFQRHKVKLTKLRVRAMINLEGMFGMSKFSMAFPKCC